MRVAVTGATGVIGSAAVGALVATGHNVVGLARTPDKAAALDDLGAESWRTDLFDRDGLVEMFSGCAALCTLSTHVPVGYWARWPRSWREHDKLRTEGVLRVLEAAREAGVRRVVQESVSFIYADNGNDWITERSPLGINRATEPAAVAESHVQDYQCNSRQGVVLRLGTIVGNDAITRWHLRSVQHGIPVGIGSPSDWVHAVHTDDLGSAVVAALEAPSGVYNVGAEPVRWADYVQGYADAVGKPSGDFMGPLLRRLSGARSEPMTRSLRVSSDLFVSQTGWAPRRPAFDASWFAGIPLRSTAFQ